MYIKYTVNCWSVFLYHDIHIRAKLIYFERGLVARGSFVVGGSLSVPRESSPGSRDECRTAHKRPTFGSSKSASRPLVIKPSMPFIVTHPESWYSFYRPTEGKRLSCLRGWLHFTYQDDLPDFRQSPI